MQLDRNTLNRLQQKNTAVDAKIKELRVKLLEYITVDVKSAVVIASKHRDEAKRTVQSIDDIESEKARLSDLIADVRCLVPG